MTYRLKSKNPAKNVFLYTKIYEEEQIFGAPFYT